jgi:hypothetical protein
MHLSYMQLDLTNLEKMKLWILEKSILVCFHPKGGENVLLLLIALAMSCMMLLTTLLTKIGNKVFKRFMDKKSVWNPLPNRDIKDIGRRLSLLESL